MCVFASPGEEARGSFEVAAARAFQLKGKVRTQLSLSLPAIMYSLLAHSLSRAIIPCRTLVAARRPNTHKFQFSLSLLLSLLFAYTVNINIDSAQREKKRGCFWVHAPLPPESEFSLCLFRFAINAICFAHMRTHTLCLRKYTR